jgi:hypothetical protein
MITLGVIVFGSSLVIGLLMIMALAHHPTPSQTGVSLALPLVGMAVGAVLFIVGVVVALQPG